MAKLLKLRRGTTTQHSSFTGAEGEVTVDTDKETLVVHDGSTAGGHAVAAEDLANVSSATIAGRLSNDSLATSKLAAGALPTDVTIVSANIVDGTIGNADVNGGAAIAGTKIAPDFGSQTVTTTGNIVVGGTVDGVDVAALKTSKDSLSTTNGTVLGSAILANGVTATTQSASDNSTKVATTAYTDTAVANLVDSSPGALNTLNELAAAVNDDANFSTTITNSIATKMPLAGGEFTGNVTCENITPDTDSSRDLGTTSVRFANVYADNFVGAGTNLTGVESFVTGMIILWSGASNAIPTGFVLCNGSNSTPDLRDRFVIGAGNSYSVGATGGATTSSDTVNISGSDTVNISGSDTVNITVSGTTGGHSHYAQSGSQYRYIQTTNQYNQMYQHNHSFSGSGSDTVNISGSDTVNISGSDTVSVSTLSPYYALCYIMKT